MVLFNNNRFERFTITNHRLCRWSLIGEGFGFELAVFQEKGGVYFAFGDIETEEGCHVELLA